MVNCFSAMVSFQSQYYAAVSEKGPTCCQLEKPRTEDHILVFQVQSVVSLQHHDVEQQEQHYTNSQY